MSYCYPNLGFATLPRELKLGIFEYITRKKDQRSVRLVNRECGILMRPRMWRECTIDVRSTSLNDTRPLARTDGLHKGTLTLEPQHDCFKYIQALTLVGPPNVPMDSPRFSKLMQLLRKDRLIEFNSGLKAPLSSEQFRELLSFQSALKVFRPCLDFSRPKRAFYYDTSPNILMESLENIIAASMQSLKVFHMVFGDGCDPFGHTFQQYEIACASVILRKARSLTDLKIQDFPQFKERGNSLTHIIRSMDGLKISSPSVRHFVLVGFKLEHAETHLYNALDFCSLTSLKLEICQNEGTLLLRLASSFHGNVPRLKSFSLSSMRGAERGGEWQGNHPFCQAVESFLRSFQSLEELTICFVGSYHMDWQRILTSHQNLKKLALPDYDGDWPSIWRKDLTNTLRLILFFCPKVTDFAFGIPLIKGSYIGLDCRSAWPLNEWLPETLEVIGTAPNIRRLTLLDFRGGLDHNLDLKKIPDWPEMISQRMQDVANEVFSIMFAKPTNLSTLALAPAQEDGPCNLYRNDPAFPSYHYKAHVTEVKGKRLVKAVPILEL